MSGTRQECGEVAFVGLKVLALIEALLLWRSNSK